MTMRKAIFSEGRGLRVRMPRPNSSRGISSPEMAGRAARGPIGRFHDEARAFLTGVRSPPLRGGLSKLGWPCGGGPRDDAGGGFLGGTRSARPHAKAGLKPRHRIPTGAFTMSRWPKRGQCWGCRDAFLAGVQSPPLPRGSAPKNMALGAKTPKPGKAAIFQDGSHPVEAGCQPLEMPKKPPCSLRKRDSDRPIACTPRDGRVLVSIETKLGTHEISPFFREFFG